jgi:elongation factor G
MSLEVTVPEALLGGVLGDLAARLGRVRDISTRDKSTSLIFGEAPMSSLFGYISDLRGRTHGRGGATITFARYERG